MADKKDNKKNKKSGLGRGLDVLINTGETPLRNKATQQNEIAIDSIEVKIGRAHV